MEISFTHSDVQMLINYKEKLSPDIVGEASFGICSSQFNSLDYPKLDPIRKQIKQLRKLMQEIRSIKINKKEFEELGEYINSLTERYESKIYDLEQRNKSLKNEIDQINCQRQSQSNLLREELQEKNDAIRLFKAEFQKIQNKDYKADIIKQVVQCYQLQQSQEIISLNNRINQLLEIIKSKDQKIKYIQNENLKLQNQKDQQQIKQRLQHATLALIQDYNKLKQQSNQNIANFKELQIQNAKLKQEINQLKMVIKEQANNNIINTPNNEHKQINQQKLLNMQDVNQNIEPFQHHSQLLSVNYRTKLSDLKKNIIIGKLSEFRKFNSDNKNIKTENKKSEKEANKKIKSFLTGYNM